MSARESTRVCAACGGVGRVAIVTVPGCAVGAEWVHPLGAADPDTYGPMTVAEAFPDDDPPSVTMSDGCGWDVSELRHNGWAPTEERREEG